MVFPGVSGEASASQPLRTLKVRIVADQNYARQSSWEGKAQAILDSVGTDIADLMGIRLDVVDCTLWRHDEEDDFHALTRRMVDEVPRGEADFLFGFTLLPHPAGQTGPRNDGVTIPYQGIMIKKYQGTPWADFFLPLVIIHEMVHLFGGVHVNDGSLMSPVFGREINLSLDPLNRQIITLTHNIDFKKGYSSLDQSTLRKLARLYKSARLQGNRETLTCLELGSIYDGLEEYDSAIRAYRDALDIEPSLTYAWLRIGDLYHKSGRPDKSIATFEEAVTRADDRDLLYGKLAVLYYNTGQYRQSYRSAVLAEQHGATIDPMLWRELKKKGLGGKP